MTHVPSEPEARLLEACREGVRLARALGAEQAEVFATRALEAKVTLEADDVASAESSEEEQFGIRVRARGATGFAATNDAGRASLEEAVRKALALAAVSPADPHGDLADPQETHGVDGLYDPALEALDVMELSKLGGELAARTRDLDPRLRIDSGGIDVRASTSAIASSTGIEASQRRTRADALLFGMAREGDRVGSFDSEQANECSRAALERRLETLPARFAGRVLSTLDAGAGESFRGTLVLSPDAVASFLLPALVAALSAQAIRTGRSRLVGRLDERAFSPGFSLRDEGTLAARPGSSSFDREGVPRRPLALVEEGVLRSYLFDVREARAAGRAAGSTGHAAGGAGAPPTIGPTNLRVAPGPLSRDALLAEVERGVLLVRFSGNTDSVSGDFSGVAKGSSLLRRGEAPRAIRETLVSGNLYELLGRVSGVGRELHWMYGTVETPLLRLEGVSVTAG